MKMLAALLFFWAAGPRALWHKCKYCATARWRVSLVLLVVLTKGLAPLRRTHHAAQTWGTWSRGFLRQGCFPWLPCRGLTAAGRGRRDGRQGAARSSPRRRSACAAAPRRRPCGARAATSATLKNKALPTICPRSPLPAFFQQHSRRPLVAMSRRLCLFSTRRAAWL